MQNKFAALLLVIAAGFPCLYLRAQTPAGPTTAAAVPYQPSFSDLMNIGVQPRHIKLWLAGKQQNWSYAAYELDELRNALARVGRTVPVYRSLDVPQVMTAYTKASLTALDTAIKARDAKAFNKAYAELTASCNACHAGAEHAMVVVKVPDTNAFADQDFRAKR